MSEKDRRESFLALAGRVYEELAPSRDGQTFEEIEQAAVEAGKKLAAGLMTERLAMEWSREQAQGGLVSCPACKKKMRIQNENAPRTLETGVAKIPYVRAYCVCDSCGFSFSPDGPEIGHPEGRPLRGGPSKTLRREHRRLL